MQFLARNVTPAIVQNAYQFDIKDLAMNMEKFQEVAHLSHLTATQNLQKHIHYIN